MSNKHYIKLPGGPKKGGMITKGFNTPSRKQQRNHLYEVIRSEIKRNGKMPLYDVYRVLRLIERKLPMKILLHSNYSHRI